MDPLRKSELLDYIDRARSVLLRENADEGVVPFLVIVICVMVAVLIIVRGTIIRMKRFRGEHCRTCGAKMKRIHQLWWLRPMGRLFPLRRMMCRECRQKTFRHYPSKGERRKRRRAAE